MRHRSAQDEMRQFFLKAPEDRSLPLSYTITQKHKSPTDPLSALNADMVKDFHLTNT